MSLERGKGKAVISSGEEPSALRVRLSYLIDEAPISPYACTYFELAFVHAVYKNI